MKYTLHNLLGFAPQIVWGGGDTGGGGGGGSDDKPKKSAGKGTAPTAKSTGASLLTDIKMGLSTIGQGKEKQAETLRDQGYSEKAISSYQERTEASKARVATTQRDDNDRPAPKPAPTPEPEVTPEPEPTPEVDTVLPPEVDEPLTEVEEIAEVTFPTEEETTALEEASGEEAAELQTQYEPEAVKEDISSDKPANVTTISTGTAAGGRSEAAAARPTSVGKAEDKAIDFYEKGRRSTILTTPRGLLGAGTEEGKTRRRRSLIGG